jgi:PQQ-like domain
MRRKRRARGSPAWMRRGVLAIVLLAVVFVPVPGAASGQQAPACRGCRAQPVNAERWATRLPGQWATVNGATGTVPASGQDYVAVGGEVAAVGGGLTVTCYDLHDGKPLWQVTLPDPAGSAIMSVRAWPGIVTAGVLDPSGRTRTEVVLDAATGSMLGRYPAAVFGGAVEASATATVIIGPDSVTSYGNADGKVRWRRPVGAGQAWRADGGTLYIAESAQGYLGSAPVTGLRVIDLDSGTERSLLSPPGHSFSGTMSIAADGAVLFTSATGVTAYSGSTGGALWSMTGALPEGADPSANLVYLTSAGGALIGVDPLTGAVKASVTGSTADGVAGMYVVRGGVALGLDSGQGGDAWGYDLAAGRVTWTAPGLPWPHYFADLSGLGGSAGQSADPTDIVVIAVCAHLSSAVPGASPTATVSAPSTATVTPPGATLRGASFTTSRQPAGPAATPSPTPVATSPASPAVPAHLCADPELVALNV